MALDAMFVERDLKVRLFLAVIPLKDLPVVPCAAAIVS